ncbi:hypothetical protein [Clostridium cadaveris]|uniref:Uncharacterized protein n=1 Tax=Clostridium cadaveris TaxID=1529 RepID=A0A316MD84_9CLOT|nr:hypothetical protein [Clostridium cadaveris]NWK12911.1 hypothetical protein [Clostridium cadaveris]PWL55189.1 MAG: hypothetical protein DBY38_02350 [Clostridium cadaveris]
MINLDKYLNKSVEIKLKGKVIEILQPSAKMTKEIGKLEKEITEENYLEIKSKIAYKLLNNNASNRKFSMEEIDEIPYKLQDLVIHEITNMIYEAENDPN